MTTLVTHILTHWIFLQLLTTPACIMLCRKSHEGVYTCEVYNWLGVRVTATATLNVRGPGKLTAATTNLAEWSMWNKCSVHCLYHLWNILSARTTNLMELVASPEHSKHQKRYQVELINPTLWLLSTILKFVAKLEAQPLNWIVSATKSSLTDFTALVFMCFTARCIHGLIRQLVVHV